MAIITHEVGKNPFCDVWWLYVSLFYPFEKRMCGLDLLTRQVFCCWVVKWILLIMQGPTADPVVRKYVALGLNRDAVPHAVANYGDNPLKVFSWV